MQFSRDAFSLRFLCGCQLHAEGTQPFMTVLEGALGLLPGGNILHNASSRNGDPLRIAQEPNRDIPHEPTSVGSLQFQFFSRDVLFLEELRVNIPCLGLALFCWRIEIQHHGVRAQRFRDLEI